VLYDTSLGFGILVIVICLLFGAWNLGFSGLTSNVRFEFRKELYRHKIMI
jgi:hypothetical protein